MTERKDDEGTTPDDLPADSTPENKSSGRVAFDARGNPIWEWQLESGVYSRDVNTNKLRKLDLGGLSLVDTGTHPKPPGLDSQEPDESGSNEMPGGGFNPYDSAPRVKAEGTNPYDNARSLSNKLAAPQKPQPPTRKATDLHKLDEWIKLRRRIANKNEDDDE